MTISASVRMALTKAGKQQKDLAELYDVTKQSMSMKFKRNAWFGKDLVRVAEYTGGKLAFIYPDGTTINIDSEKEEAPDVLPSEAGQ